MKIMFIKWSFTSLLTKEGKLPSANEYEAADGNSGSDSKSDKFYAVSESVQHLVILSNT